MGKFLWKSFKYFKKNWKFKKLSFLTFSKNFLNILNIIFLNFFKYDRYSGNDYDKMLRTESLRIFTHTTPMYSSTYWMSAFFALGYKHTRTSSILISQFSLSMCDFEHCKGHSNIPVYEYSLVLTLWLIKGRLLFIVVWWKLLKYVLVFLSNIRRS